MSIILIRDIVDYVIRHSSADDEELNPLITLFWNFWLSFVELIQDLSVFIFFGLSFLVWCKAVSHF